MARRGKTPKTIFAPCRGGGIELRQPLWADYDDWATLRRANREHLTPWEPSWNAAHLTRPSYRARLASFKTMVAGDKGYPFHIFRADDDQLVGACNLTHVKRGSLQSAHIGYWVAAEYARKGFARAAIGGVLRYAFEELGLHRINAAVGLDNTASIQLLKNCGFHEEGLAREYLKIDGAWVDHLIYAKLNHD